MNCSKKKPTGNQIAPPVARNRSMATLTIMVYVCTMTQFASCSRGSGDDDSTALALLLLSAPCQPYLLAGTMQGCTLELEGMLSRYAGSGTDAHGDGDLSSAHFEYPQGITTDGQYFYVADSNNYRIRRIDIEAGVVTTLAGSGSSGDLDGLGQSAQFDWVVGITTDGKDIYFTDTYNNKIKKLTLSTGVVSTFAGTGASGSTDGPGLSASFNTPHKITNDGDFLYVADYNNPLIRKISIATGEVSTLAGAGSPSCADGLGTAAHLTLPTGITTDGTNLYVADPDCWRIRKIEIATGRVTSLTFGDNYGDVDGSPQDARFEWPMGITTDGSYLYFADQQAHKIKRLDLSDNSVRTIVGDGTSGDGTGPATSSRLHLPEDVVIYDGHLYIMDALNNKIKKLE